jgi:hypothetical protein
VEIVMHSFFVSLPLAVVVWLIMLLVLGALIAFPRRARAAGRTWPVEDLRYADEVSIAARRAAATADRHRTEWIAAQEALDAAWTEFDAADRAARATAKAGAFPLMSRRRKPGENVDRQRYLHHAASEACRHRQISIAQLNDVFAHRGWNPRLHPVFQEIALRNAIRDHRLADYQAALENERKAWQAAEMSAQAVRSLRLEVAAAIARSSTRQPAPDEQWWAEQWATADLPAAA